MEKVSKTGRQDNLLMRRALPGSKGSSPHSWTGGRGGRGRVGGREGERDGEREREGEEGKEGRSTPP